MALEIVEDQGFLCLMKTGQPEHYVPSALRLGRNVWLVFARTQGHIAKLFQVSVSYPSPQLQ